MGDRPAFEFTRITPNDVLDLLKQIPDSKPTALDGLPIKFVKINLDVSSKLLYSYHIVNSSLAKPIVLDRWKVACLTPLFEGVRDDPSNYCPLAILPACSKIIERIVHIQVSNYLKSYNILSDA